MGSSSRRGEALSNRRLSATALHAHRHVAYLRGAAENGAEGRYLLENAKILPLAIIVNI
jgi:hypothetical protein